MGTKNLPAQKYSSGQRTEKTLRFLLDTGSNETTLADQTVYIDLAKALSEVNRKHYRQGLYYYISSVELQDAMDGSTVDIETLCDNWVTKNAWIRGHQHWNRINARSAAPLAKYADFKIRMTSATASGTVQIPVQGGNGSANNSSNGGADEWNRSEFKYNKTAEAGAMGSAAIYMAGDHTGSFPDVTGYGLVKGYSETRRNKGDITSGDEPIPTGATTDILLVDGSDGHPDLTLNKIEENDLTPYDHDDYYGTAAGDLTRQYRLTVGNGAARAATIQGFCVPLGLLKLTASAAGEYSITIKLTPGPYHGVYAERVYDEQ